MSIIYLFQIFLVSLVITRFLALLFFKGVMREVSLVQKVWDDNYHHYQFGLIGLAITLILWVITELTLDKFVTPDFQILTAVFIGIIIEEYPVIIENLKFEKILPPLKKFKYLGTVDNTLVFLTIFLGFIFSFIIA